MNRLLFGILAIILITCTLISGCSKQTTITTTPSMTASPAAVTTTIKPPASTTTAATSAAPKSGGILRIIINEAPAGSIGLPEKMGGVTNFYTNSIIERLIQVTAQGEFIPRLATSYEYSNNDTIVTFHLRKGVKFHDGTDFTAQAVKWNFDRRIVAKVAGTENIVSIETPDDYTVKINLKEFINTWIGKLGGENANDVIGFMISPASVQKNGEEWASTHQIGTGPFKFKEFQIDNHFEVERFDGYWGDKAFLNGIRWIIVKDPVTAELSFQSGEGDALWAVGKSAQVLQDLSNKGYVSDYYAGLLFFLVPASGNPNSPLSKLGVRQAIECAIDKEKITQSIFHGFSSAQYQVAAPGYNNYITDFQGNRFDVAKAKKLLSDAGYSNGFDTTIWCQVGFQGDAITAMQAYLQAIGIRAKIEIIEVPKWVDMVTNGWDDGLLIHVSGTVGYGAFLTKYWIRPTAPSYSRGFYWKTLQRPDDIEALIQKYLRLTKKDEMIATGREIIQKTSDNELVIPLWYSTDAVMVQKYVRGFNVGEIEYTNFISNQVWLDK